MDIVGADGARYSGSIKCRGESTSGVSKLMRTASASRTTYLFTRRRATSNMIAMLLLRSNRRSSPVPSGA